MYGVTFGEKHSYKDWGLTLKTRPVISPPSPKTIYVDIPAADGIIDLTESLAGEVKYENRKITCEFNVTDSRKRWSDIYSDILDYLHGKKMNVIFDEDPTYYYIGRWKVNEWKSDKATSTIIIEGTVEPYKLELFSSTDDWEWDSFNFESGIIQDFKNMVVEGTLNFTVIGSRKSVIPTITVESSDGNGMTYNHMGQQSQRVLNLHLNDGVTKNPTIVYKDGETWVTITGNGTISVDFRGGRL